MRHITQEVYLRLFFVKKLGLLIIYVVCGCNMRRAISKLFWVYALFYQNMVLYVFCYDKICNNN